MKKTKKELAQHKKKAVNDVESYIDHLLSGNDINNSKADKFCYWLEDYITFLKFEEQFTPKRLRRYKRGEIIKAHLGYNVGCEEGGLHYCVVLDKNNSVNSPVITIVPLTSVKPNTDLDKLYPTEVYLGNELFTSLNAKMSAHKRAAEEKVNYLNSLIEKLKNDKSCDVDQAITDVEGQIEDLLKRLTLINSMRKEIQRMKQGSIALVNQVRVISKIRIYDPKRNEDVLSNIKLSNERLDAIDKALITTYTNMPMESI